jgi:hypothetical protein
MPTLTEAETAAYLNPSQENLAVYVKLLEEHISDLGDARRELIESLPSPEDVEELRERIADLERELDDARAAE